MSTSEYVAAGNQETSREDLDQLARSGEFQIRRRVAENPNCPTGALQILANDEHPEVRSNVARNPKATFEMLRMLAKDFSLNVRFALAEEQNLPRPILRMLSRDDNPYIADRAKVSLNNVKREKSQQRRSLSAARQQHAI